jgi:hypothetical protein
MLASWSLRGLDTSDRTRLRRSLTLEIRHEGLGARVERVDHHLSVCRTGDLDPARGSVMFPPQHRDTHRLSSSPGPGGAHAHPGVFRISAVSGRKPSVLP